MPDVARMRREMEEGKANPRDVKMTLGEEIVSIYHGREKAAGAREEFLKIFSRREMPTEIPLVTISPDRLKGEGGEVADVMVLAGLASSKREARRLILQGAVKVDGEKVFNEKQEMSIAKETVMQVGSRRFARIAPAR
jgi:tyrosyl-tRNA synthetase